MSDGEQSHAAWLTEQHRRAQAFALGWAERAETEYDTATEHEDKARRFADKAYLAEPMADERRLAQFHGVRSTEALKLAEMWARVARALADAPTPAEVLVVNGTLTEQDASYLRARRAAARTPGHPG